MHSAKERINEVAGICNFTLVLTRVGTTAHNASKLDIASAPGRTPSMYIISQAVSTNMCRLSLSTHFFVSRRLMSYFVPRS